MIIYKITNDVNGKSYIGQTKRTLSYRWSMHKSFTKRGSNYAFHSAIREYGAEHFHVEQIDIASDIEEACIKEKYWIEKLGTMVPNGYNMTHGGEISKPNSGINHWAYGKKIPEETLQKKHDALYRKPSARSRPVRCVETGEVQPFAKEFFYKYGYQHSKILECCKGRRQTHRGFHWEYAEEVI